MVWLDRDGAVLEPRMEFTSPSTTIAYGTAQDTA